MCIRDSVVDVDVDVDAIVARSTIAARATRTAGVDAIGAMCGRSRSDAAAFGKKIAAGKRSLFRALFMRET